MADTNYISKVTLPSVGTTGVTYYIKDEEARQMISGGISFKIVWAQTDFESTTAPSSAKLATIPAGTIVSYNSGASTATGTLPASEATVAIFYLIYSKTQAGNIDTYDEIVTIKDDSTTPITYFWERIGDTQIDLSNVVTGFTKVTDNVIGSNATFTITQPTIALATDTTSGTGKVQVATGISSASASGDSVTALTGLGTPSTDTFLKGVKVTAQPSVTLTANKADATGRLKYVEDVTGGSTSPTKVHLSATASGGAVSASGDSVTALTGLGTPSTSAAVSGVSTAKLAVTSVTGVQSSTTTASKATAGTSQTTVSGFSTSTSNDDFLRGISVSNETLIFGAASPNSQTTTQFTFTDVTVPIKAASATTVATGSTTSSGTGATVATGSSGTINAVTGYASPTTDTVLGTASTFAVTNPTITVSTSGSTGPQVVGDVSDITVSPTYKYMSGSASGTTVGANGTGTAVTALGTPTTDTVLGTGSTITVTPTTTYIKGTASGANTAWNNKDQVEVLTSASDVVKGGASS